LQKSTNTPIHPPPPPRDAVKKKHPIEPLCGIPKTIYSVLLDQLRKLSTEECPTCERMTKMLEDELRKELQARQDKLEEYRQEWIKNAPEREKKEREERECRVAELKVKGLPLPPELDPKLARERVWKEYQTKRANLWHSRYGHCSFNELKNIRSQHEGVSVHRR
jgi:hypothetical protein